MIVYKITNMINGKCYVGQTVQSLHSRWKNHCNSSSCTALRSAIDKYGKENFLMETLEECSDLDTLNEREEFWIKDLKTISPGGYNLKTGGKNSRPSEETKKKMSTSQIGRKLTEEHKAKLSRAKLGKKRKPHTEDTKKKMSDWHKKNSHMIGKTESKHHNAKKIYCYETDQVFNSIIEASRELVIHRNSITNFLSGLTKSTRQGYTFKYVNEEVCH